MINLFAGYKTQIRVLERKLKELDHTKLNPSKVKELTEAIKNLKDLVQEKEQKREERRKAKEDKAKEIEAAPKPEVEDNKVILPKDEFIKEHEHIDELLKPVEKERKEQVEELKEVKEASPTCATCGGVTFKSYPEYKSHMEQTHVPKKEYAPMDPALKKDITKDVEHKLGPAIISEKEDKAELIKFGLDDKVEPVRGEPGSKGRVMRHDDNNPATLVYVYWDEGPLAEKDHFGGYYSKDLKKVEEPKPVEAAVEEPKAEPPHNPGPEHKCPECDAWREKESKLIQSGLRENYDALLKDLKDERAIHYESGNYKWTERLDQKIQDLEKAIAEKFGNEKQSAQVEHHDPIGHGMGDLYILPNSPEEAQKIIKFVEDSGRTYTWSMANVEGHKWFGKRFIEVPFGMDIEKDMREHFANTPLHTRPVEEIMAKKEAGKVHMHECVRGHAQSCDERLCNNPEQKVPSSKCTQCRSRKQSNFEGKCDLCKGPVCERCKQCHNCVKITGAAKEAGAQNSESLCVMDHTPARANTSADEIGTDSHDEFQDEWSEPKIASINVFNKKWTSKATKKAGKISYEISDESGKKILSLSPLNGKEMNAEHLKWAVERETTKGYKKATLKENISFMKKGSKVWVISDDGKKAKIANLEAGVRAYVQSSKIQLEALESQAVTHGSHSDKVLGSTATETLLDCIEGGPIWVNSTELLDANRPPATPESLNLEESKDTWDNKQSINVTDVIKKKHTNTPECGCGGDCALLENKKKHTNTPSCPCGGDCAILSEKQSSKDCPDCHGNFAGKEDEKCPTCGRFSIKEAAKGNHREWAVRLDGHKIVSTHATEEEAKKALDAIPSHYFVSGEVVYRDVSENEKEALRTQLPPLLPDERAHVNADIKVEKPEYKCPVCGKSTYFKSAEGYRPFCSAECAKKGASTKVNASTQGTCKYCGMENVAIERGLCKSCQEALNRKHASTEKKSSKDCPDCHGTFAGKENEKCPTCGRFSVQEKEGLRTQLPSLLPDERAHVNASTEKKADGEVLSAEGLDMYANNTSELYPEKQQIITHIKDMIESNSYEAPIAFVLWEKWFRKAADRYVREFPEDPKPTHQSIRQAAKEIEPYELEKVMSGEYGPINEAETDINKLPTMNVEQEKDKLIDQLAKETDPEKKKSLERRYKHLTMASLNKVSFVRQENGSGMYFLIQVRNLAKL